MRPPSRSVTIAGHFGELLQGRFGPDGPIALVTLPCNAAHVCASWRAAPAFALHAPGLHLPPGSLRALLRRAPHATRGQLLLRASAPPGTGCGMSSAALLAAARVLGVPFGPAELVGLEGASDPLHLADPAQVLWASREGRSLAALPPLPALEVLGGFRGAAGRTDPADTRFADISDLVASWQEKAGNARALAALASQSAKRNRALRGGPDLAPLAACAARLGALGYAVAHTGNAEALLFAPGTCPPVQAAQSLREIGMTGLRQFAIESA